MMICEYWSNKTINLNLSGPFHDVVLLLQLLIFNNEIHIVDVL